MIVRHHDAAQLNAVLNHPVVRPWVADEREGVLDVSAAVANPRNVLLLGEHGGCLFFYLMPGVYEVHTQVLPEGRGAWARDMLDHQARWMFTRTDCVEILTRIPDGHKGAYAAAMSMGFKAEFVRWKECLFKGKMTDVLIASLDIRTWVGMDGEIEAKGQWFHTRLHAEALRLGIVDRPHADDPNHNRYVGAAYLMGVAGQARKAVAWYNRWALASRHAPIALVSENPLTIKMDIGLLRFANDDLELLTC